MKKSTNDSAISNKQIFVIQKFLHITKCYTCVYITQISTFCEVEKNFFLKFIVIMPKRGKSSEP